VQLGLFMVDRHRVHETDLAVDVQQQFVDAEDYHLVACYLYLHDLVLAGGYGEGD